MSRHKGYARFTVIVYTGENLPIRPTLNYFEWNAPEPKPPHSIVNEDISDGYHRHQVVSYACKIVGCITGRDRDLAISA